MPPSVPLITAPSALITKAFSWYENKVINHALQLLERNLTRYGDCLSNPKLVRNYLQLKLANMANEVFAVMFLTNKHRLISFEILFQGTISKTTVHPRVILQRALFLNASALVVVHTHPAGDTIPSSADIYLTACLKQAIEHLDICLLDHFIVGSGTPFSFAEAGLL